jgi:hypothetical protein
MVTKTEYQDEIQALKAVLGALAKLNAAGQRWVLATAASRLSITVPHGTGGSSGTGTTAQSRGTGGQPAEGTLTSKEFMRQKAPKSDVQRVACLAYYLAHHRNLSAFKARDLTALNRDAAGPKLNMSRAMDNATKHNNYLSPAGKGQKQITAHGEDVVNALPDQEAAKAAEATGKPRRRRAAKKSRAKTRG